MDYQRLTRAIARTIIV